MTQPEAGYAAGYADAYPVDPEAQRQWLEDSLASRLADLKAKFEGPKPKGDRK